MNSPSTNIRNTRPFFIHWRSFPLLPKILTCLLTNRMDWKFGHIQPLKRRCILLFAEHHCRVRDYEPTVLTGTRSVYGKILSVLSVGTGSFACDNTRARTAAWDILNSASLGILPDLHSTFSEDPIQLNGQASSIRKYATALYFRGS